MIISREKTHHVASAYLGGQVLELVGHYKYLGFHLSAYLSWSYHIQCICNKARKIMGILYRQFSSNVDSHAMLKLYSQYCLFSTWSSSLFLSPSGLRSSISVNQFKILFTHTNPYIYYNNSFFCSVTQLWNNLPLEAITCTNVTLFKQLIYPLFS